MKFLHHFASLCICCVWLLSVSTETAAQGRVNPHGYFTPYPGALTAGIAAGPTVVLATGGPTGTCDCEYDAGSGLGYNIGIALDVHLNRLLALRLQGLFETHSSTFSKDVARTLYASDGAPVAAISERRFEADLQYSSLSMHLLWFTGLGNLFVSVGAGAGFYVDGTVTDDETLKTPGIFYQQGSNNVVYHDGPLGEIAETSVRASLIAGFGYDFPISRGFAIAPEVQLDVPLSSVTTEDSDWKQMAIRINVAFRIGI